MAAHVLRVPYLSEGTGLLLRGIAVLAPVSAAQYALIVIRRVSTPVEAVTRWGSEARS